MTKETMREYILKDVRNQGFSVTDDGKIDNFGKDKEGLKALFKVKMMESFKNHSSEIYDGLKLYDKYAIDGKDLDVKKISPEIRIVEDSGSEEFRLFKWWDLSYRSAPYTNGRGKLFYIFIWDKYHDAPMGQISLASPPTSMPVLSKYLGIETMKFNEQLKFYNDSCLYGQRISAFPPYNSLLGGKLLIYAVLSDEMADTILKRTKKEMHFYYTTSLFGKSSMYDRIRYGKRFLEIYLGTTKGAGSILTAKAYERLKQFLRATEKGLPRTVSSPKMRIIYAGLAELGLKDLIYHNMGKGIYLFPRIKNLKDVCKDILIKPDYYEGLGFEKMVEYWKERYLMPRSNRVDEWRKFSSREFIGEILMKIGQKTLQG